MRRAAAANDSVPRAATRRQRAALLIGVLGLALLALVAVRVSRLEATFGTLVFGSAALWRGHTAVLRLAVRAVPSDKPIEEAVHARVLLRDGAGVRAEAAGKGIGFVDLRLEIPADLDAYPFLDIEAGPAQGADVDRFTLPAHSAETPGPLAGTLESSTAVLDPDARHEASLYRLEVFPSGGKLGMGFTNDVAMRLTRAGEPVTGALTCDEPPLQATANAAGIWRLAVRPMPGHAAWRCRVQATHTSITTTLRLHPQQVMLTARPSIFVTPSEPLALVMSSLPLREPIYLDVWVGDALVDSTSYAAGGERPITLTLPPDSRGFVRLDAYRSTAPAGRGSMSLLLWASTQAPGDAPGDAADDALTAMAKLPGDEPLLWQARRAPSEVRHELAGLVMSRYAPPGAGMPLVRDSLPDRVTQVARLKRRLEAHVKAAIVLALGVLLGLGAQLLRARRRQALALAAELGDEPPVRSQPAWLQEHPWQEVLVLGASVTLAAYALWLWSAAQAAL